MDQLPCELVHAILGFLNAVDLLPVRQVSRALAQCSLDRTLWDARLRGALHPRVLQRLHGLSPFRPSIPPFLFARMSISVAICRRLMSVQRTVATNGLDMEIHPYHGPPEALGGLQE